MIFFWILYFSLSLIVSFLLTSFIKKRLLKVLVFSISFSLISSLWFKSPGDTTLVPIISIFFLENTILESNGLWRIIRPLSLFFVITFILSIFFWKNKSND